MQRHADNPPIRIYFLMNRLLDSNFTLHNSAYIINPQFNSLLNYLTFSNNLVFVHFERNEATGEDRAIIFPEIKGIPRTSLKFWMHSVALRLRYVMSLSGPHHVSSSFHFKRDTPNIRIVTSFNVSAFGLFSLFSLFSPFVPKNYSAVTTTTKYPISLSCHS